MMVVKDVIENPKIVYGGGSPEAYVALKLREWAKSLSGREQLAVEKFADAMESIPLALARNAGMNPIDSITQLRSKQNAGGYFTGVDVINGTIASFEDLGVIEPLKVKEQIIKSATETANMILRIGNVIAVSRSAPSEPQGMPPGGMGMY
jgi:chaperonin GroEL (HSP60 family)